MRQFHAVMAEVLGSGELDRQLDVQISEVLSQMFKRVYDPPAMVERFFGEEATAAVAAAGDLDMARPNPPYCTAALTNQVVVFFETKCVRSKKLFSYLLRSHPGSLQRMAQELCSSLRDCRREHALKDDECARNLHGLDLFLGRVTREATELRPQLPYLTCFLANSLVAVLRHRDSPGIRRIACHVLKDVVKLALDGVERDVATNLVVRPARHCAVELMMRSAGVSRPCIQLLEMIVETIQSGSV